MLHTSMLRHYCPPNRQSSIGRLQTVAGHVCAASPVASSHSAATAQANQLQSNAAVMGLIPWAIKNGIQYAKIKPVAETDTGGRGIVATAEIAPGECVCSVPVSAALRVFPGCSPVLQIPQALWQQLPWYCQLALTVLHELQQGTACKRAEYIRLLPSEVDVPALWTEEEVQQLNCSYFIEQVHQQQEEWAALQQQVAPYLAAVGLSQDQLFWALSVARSRAFAAPYAATPFAQLGLQLGWMGQQAKQPQTRQEQQQHVMCPLLDLFNHSGDVQSECEYVADLRSPAFRVVASQAWRRGEQVFINYGSSSNDALLQLYGFVQADNEHDRYVVSSLSAVLQEKGLMLSDISNSQPATDLAQVVFTMQGIPASVALHLASLACPDEPSSQSHKPSGTVPYSALKPSVQALCAAAVQAELDKLSVNPSHDQEVLRAFAELPSKQVELSEKQAELMHVAEKLQQLQSLLEAEHSKTDTQQDTDQQQQQQQPPEQVQEQGPAPELQQASDGPNSAADDDSQLQKLSDAMVLCQQLHDQLQMEVSDLQQVTTAWQQTTQQHKEMAVSFRLQKHYLLSQLLVQLS